MINRGTTGSDLSTRWYTPCYDDSVPEVPSLPEPA